MFATTSVGSYSINLDKISRNFTGTKLHSSSSDFTLLKAWSKLRLIADRFSRSCYSPCSSSSQALGRILSFPFIPIQIFIILLGSLPFSYHFNMSTILFCWDIILLLFIRIDFPLCLIRCFADYKFNSIAILVVLRFTFYCSDSIVIYITNAN